MITSGRAPPSWLEITSMACRESRGVPATTMPPVPANWSFIMLIHWAPRRPPQYLGLGRAWIVGMGTTNRMPSIAATSPPPHSRASPIPAWASISAALAVLYVSARM
jgi:hypothetical protein